ncbi:MAG: hypothetical protein JKY65_11735 [Planctomycetes bacterium]|nr:hypothetical protein [Planctomycetota bacterium]
MAVLAVVGICLPLLFWMFGDSVDPAASGAPGPSGSMPGASAVPLLAAPGAPSREAAAGPPVEVAPDLEEARVRIGPAPQWGSDSLWQGSVPGVNVAHVFTATYTGRVIDSSGGPVPNTEVRAGGGLIPSFGHIEETANGYTARTNSEGRFRLLVDDANVRQLVLTPPAEGDLVRAGHDVASAQQWTTLDVGDLRLVQGGRIEGRVFDPAGAPLAGVSVRLQQGLLAADRGRNTSPGGVIYLDGPELNMGNVEFSFGETGGPLLTLDAQPFSNIRGQLISFTSESLDPVTTSRADGSYVLHGVRPGTHSLVASQAQSAIARRDGVSVLAHQVRPGVDFRLAPGPVVEVTVVDAGGTPIQGAQVWVSDAEGLSQQLVTDARGVVVSPQPFATRRFDLWVTASGMLAQGSAVQAPDGVERFRVRVALLAAAQLRGRTDSGGRGSVFAHSRGERGVFIDSSRGEDGSFSWPALTPGRYDLLLVDPRGQWQLLAREVVVRPVRPSTSGPWRLLPWRCCGSKSSTRRGLRSGARASSVHGKGCPARPPTLKVAANSRCLRATIPTPSWRLGASNSASS